MAPGFLSVWATPAPIVRHSLTMRYRLTGLGTPFGSLSWERKDDDREIARRVISLLEDRRVLYEDIAWETPGECLHSAERTRHDLTALIANGDISDGLAQQVKLLRSYFRTFMSHRHDLHHMGGHGYGADPFSVALGELRAKVGTVIGDLAARFDLEVEPDLASIIPVDEGGFFALVLR